MHGGAIFARELFDAQHGDDVLQLFVAGERLADLLRNAVMPRAHDLRRHHLRSRPQQIDGGIQPFAGPLAREHDGGREVAEGVDGGGIAEIVGGHVDRLHRGDGRRRRAADALFEIGEFGGEGGLIAEPRGKLPHEPRDLGAGLNEAEDVVDQEQHVLAGIVAEVFRHGQRGVADAEARAGRIRSSGRRPARCSSSTPAVCISRYSSSPSRQRSPIPQKTLTPL